MLVLDRGQAFYFATSLIYMTEGTEHSGIIVVARQSYSVGEQLRGLQKLVLCMSSEEIRNQLIFLGAYI